MIFGLSRPLPLHHCITHCYQAALKDNLLNYRTKFGYNDNDTALGINHTTLQKHEAATTATAPLNATQRHSTPLNTTQRYSAPHNTTQCHSTPQQFQRQEIALATYETRANPADHHKVNMFDDVPRAVQ